MEIGKSMVLEGKNICRRATIYLSAFLIFFLQLSSPLWDSSGILFAGEKTCKEKLAKAEEYYYEEAFEEAQALILDCLNASSCTKEEQIKAYAILTRISLARDNTKAARALILKILKINPAYSPTVEEETPRYVNLVAEIKKEFVSTKEAPAKEQRPADSKSTWIWIGAGAAAVTTAVIILIAGGAGENSNGKEKSLPTPPPFPQ